MRPTGERGKKRRRGYQTAKSREEWNEPIPGVFVSDPYPVVIPHPNKHAFSSGAFSLTATTENFETTVYCEKVDVPI